MSYPACRLSFPTSRMLGYVGCPRVPLVNLGQRTSPVHAFLKEDLIGGGLRQRVLVDNSSLRWVYSNSPGSPFNIILAHFRPPEPPGENLYALSHLKRRDVGLFTEPRSISLASLTLGTDSVSLFSPGLTEPTLPHSL